MTRNGLLQRLQAIRFRGSQALLLLESHPLTLDREAEVRSHVVWLRVCVTAADDLSGDRDRIAQVPREAFTLEQARLGRGSEMVKRD
jgi:hypothetical protein